MVRILRAASYDAKQRGCNGKETRSQGRTAKKASPGPGGRAGKQVTFERQGKARASEERGPGFFRFSRDFKLVAAAEFHVIAADVKSIAPRGYGCHDLQRNGALHFRVVLRCGLQDVICGEVHHDKFSTV